MGGSKKKTNERVAKNGEEKGKYREMKYLDIILLMYNKDR